MQVRTVNGADVPAYADGIRRVYADVFSAPPWNEDPAAAASYAERLATDAERPGFTAALALDADTVTGFATAWTTPAPFPNDRSYGQVAAALGPGRVTEWLCGAVEVDELAVGPAARGAGLGAALLAAVTEAAPDGRCWLLTSVRAEDTLRFYRRLGWHRIDAPVPGRAGLAVLLGPRHAAGIRALGRGVRAPLQGH
ncbi:GNAT family N-acetyltransferase [Streptomyces sp. NPDC059499]|uniref:GNAT family N-acetyltransferase n=1 Tax=Streptomyces sp. NPDC059499 TaxID=3346852 RepID=UPI0036BAB406